MDTSPEVVVVGAGLAGLAAARRLADEAVEVVVVEARERVGGRVWSATLENRAVVELGAEWIGADEDAVLGLVERFELSVADTGVDYRLREAAGLTRAEQEAFLREAARVWSEVDTGGVSAGEMLDRVPGTEAQRQALRMRLQGTCGAHLGEIAARAVDADGSLAAETARNVRLVKGNQELATELAYSLDDVRLGWAVGAVVDDGVDGVTVRSGPNEVRARAAIVAVPAPIAARLRYEPGLPPELASALHELPMGVASKLAVGTKGRPTRRALQSIELPMWCWVADGPDGESRRCVTSFAGSPAAQASLGADTGRISPWLDRLRDMNPDLELVGEPLWYAWADDPFTLGAYSAWDERSWDRHELFQTTVGRVAFAGEHTAGPRHFATMDGAVRSGIRAAEQALELLG